MDGYNQDFKQERFLLTYFVILAIVSIGYTFYKTVILGDFEVISESSSDGLNIQ